MFSSSIHPQTSGEGVFSVQSVLMCTIYHLDTLPTLYVAARNVESGEVSLLSSLFDKKEFLSKFIHKLKFTGFII